MAAWIAGASLPVLLPRKPPNSPALTRSPARLAIVRPRVSLVGANVVAASCTADSSAERRVVMSTSYRARPLWRRQAARGRLRGPCGLLGSLGHGLARNDIFILNGTFGQLAGKCCPTQRSVLARCRTGRWPWCLASLKLVWRESRGSPVADPISVEPSSW